MTLESYLLFVVASIALCIAPGPDMIFILSSTLGQGKKAGRMAAIGINVGGYVHLFAAALGLSAILMASARAFTIVKWVGACYLIYIGIQVLRSKQNPLTIDGTGVKEQSPRRLFWQGFLSDVLNPKVAIFFLAFLPQFVSVEAEHPTLQIIFLGVTTNVIAIIINLLLVYFAGSLTCRLRSNERIAARLNKFMGLVFIGLGLRLAGEKV
jgi:threonine/homoserine/homoserine lactone efflux protein